MPNEALKKTTLPKITFIGVGSGERLGVQPTIEAAIDRQRALEGADYALNMIQVGGYEPGTPRVIYGNVPNDGLIDNLPPECDNANSFL